MNDLFYTPSYVLAFRHKDGGPAKFSIPDSVLSGIKDQLAFRGELSELNFPLPDEIEMEVVEFGPFDNLFHIEGQKRIYEKPDSLADSSEPGVEKLETPINE